MPDRGTRASRYGLENHGIRHTGRVYWNLTTAHLYEEAVKNGEGVVAHGGPLVVLTGTKTGRSQGDKFIVQEPTTADEVWWGAINRPFEPDHFDRVHERVLAYLQDKNLYVQDLLVGADTNYQHRVRFVCELAWHNLFVRTLFLRPTAEELPDFVPDFTVISVPNMHAEPSIDHTRSGCFILGHLDKRLVLIGGTHYAGEMKKSIFTLMNWELPKRRVLSMHCSANYDPETKEVALFFGLSGTGKTTLSADLRRRLVGDDEHVWAERGVFNLEGGCYAKVIRLSPEDEPQIWAAINAFGTVLENVVIDPDTRVVDFNDKTYTENTRGAYPLSNVPNADLSGRAGHPSNIVFLTCDAFGVMPPIARLTPEQAMYHFLSGYTARVAGTELIIPPHEGQKDEGPQAIFSACFGAPFMVRPPSVYAELLGEKIHRHHVACWLINTGWTGGPAARSDDGPQPGTRIKIPHTRAMIDAALSGALANVEYRHHDVLNLDVPVEVPGVPSELLDPRSTWSDPEAYDIAANRVAVMFQENFRAFEDEVPPEIRDAGPRPA